ncbi:T9SS type A sorting domain-containing protein [Adhaeribacter sp. BT258]|uniref:T9SS type A sorting domain-containing protein n=1 Tax=Adhaeribacter terrigena TaxID=2793070 RepID=A0ABS1C636_9BACT|nr:T9SS type A sorting domain-containing protein [Adhaeribacter terrigena]MBK0404839.1 T9SS type A sorting domain-containing protein [Adhaeribacter terrigena]
MKKLLLLLGLCCGIGSAQAQFTSPNLGMRFSLNDMVTAGAATLTSGAYVVSQDLTLATTDTLLISTNETIKLGDNIRITIEGTLLINPPDSVKITALNSADKFHTLRFETATGMTPKLSKLKKTIVEHGSGVRVIGAGLEMDSCVVRFNERAAQSGAINVSGNVPVTVTNSKIYKNARAGVSTPANGATVIIRNNWFFENGQEPGLYPQINLGPANAGPIEITGNTIIGINATTNRSGGIAIANLLGSSAITEFLIANNTIRQNSYGVNVTGTNMKGYIKGNLLEGNKVFPDPNAAGSGINFFSSGGPQDIVVSRNIIRDNRWGVTIQSGATVKAGPKPSLGRINPIDTADVGLNQIYNNFTAGTSGHSWDLYNNTTDTIYAQNNIWGTTDTTVIETHIYHKVDNASHGPVIFTPIYKAPATGIRPGIAQNAPALYPNPATDLVKLELNGMVLNEKSNLRFYNNLGQEVLNVQAKGQAGTLEINTSNLPAGLYMYRLENGTKTYTGKLLINR